VERGGAPGDGEGEEAEGRRRHRASPKALPLHRHGEPASLRVSRATA
jgi:hypothetical protein